MSEVRLERLLKDNIYLNAVANFSRGQSSVEIGVKQSAKFPDLREIGNLFYRLASEREEDRSED